MTLDKTQAAQALAEIGASQRRSSSLYSYTRSAPYMALAGLMWLVADLLLQFSSLNKTLIWPVVSGLGTLVFIALALVQNRTGPRPGSAAEEKARDGVFWRIMGVWLTVFIFMAATFTVFQPTDGVQTHTFIGVFFGCTYAVIGLWMGWRLVATGIALTALSLFGFFEVHQYYLAFMGVVGGGALMLSALWMRIA
jgi:hypothetical protein